MPDHKHHGGNTFVNRALANWCTSFIPLHHAFRKGLRLRRASFGQSA
jgi:hypothetical protein